jgi:hypothetical protein
MSGEAGTLCVMVAAGWIATHAAVHAQELPADFGWFASLAGSCWEGVFPDGRTRHRQCYATQFGRFLRGTAQLSADREGRAAITFEGDSVFAWNAERGGFEYTIWGSDGSLRGLAARYEGDELVFPVPARDDPSRIAYRSVWKRIDADRFEVRRERPVDGGWRSDLTVTYRRVQP